MNVLAIYKAETGEMYNFHFDDDQRSHIALILTLARYAGDPELSFTWHDATILSRKAQGMRERMLCDRTSEM